MNNDVIIIPVYKYYLNFLSSTINCVYFSVIIYQNGLAKFFLHLCKITVKSLMTLWKLVFILYIKFVRFKNDYHIHELFLGSGNCLVVKMSDWSITVD